MKLKGRITISRITSNTPRRSWLEITLTDESSGIPFAEIDIDYNQFAQAVTGLGNQPCGVKLSGLDLIGKG